MHDASSESNGGGRAQLTDRPPPFALVAEVRWRLRARSAPGWLAFAAALALWIMPIGCGTSGRHETMTAAPERPLSDVLAAHTPELMKLPGVVGTAESRLENGRPCILVMVVRLTGDLRRRIPRAIEGWPVRIQETGEIHAMPDSAR